MNRRAVSTLLLLALIAGWLGAEETVDKDRSSVGTPVTLRFSPEGTFKIRGTSTLHAWHCDVTRWEGVATLTDPGDPASLAEAQVLIPVEGIACGNGTMDAKLRKALKAEDHPVIQFVLTRVDTVQAGEGEQILVLTGDLSIAGVTREETLNVRIKPMEGGWKVSGEKSLSMKAFGINPPTAMLGTLRTGDEVTVMFELEARTP